MWVFAYMCVVVFGNIPVMGIMDFILMLTCGVEVDMWRWGLIVDANKYLFIMNISTVVNIDKDNTCPKLHFMHLIRHVLKIVL